ncbi:MAG: isoprenyl transferase [Bacteroidales bacterium]|nr:isoprenyl transferase [Bacteroidales bacterium]MCF8389707.1 isoprenyl transferase [Bacteroidales bacterium]
MASKEQVNRNALPSHVAVIMDGNGRWAQKHGKQRVFGHQNGVVSVRDTVEAAAELGIKYLTLYAFSTENWNRPQEEVDALMMLLVHSIKSEMESLQKNKVSLGIIGDTEKMPENVRDELYSAIDETKNNTGLKLILALSYSGRWEILNAVRKLARDIKNKDLDESDLSFEHFENYLETSKIPDPELLIRTSGEFRISNFLLWQIAYTELYFTDVLWPDFRKADFFDAIVDYQSRERRFGKISAQIKVNKENEE